MEKFFKAEKLSVMPEDPKANAAYEHWKSLFEFYMKVVKSEVEDIGTEEKRMFLESYLSIDIASKISHIRDYDRALSHLNYLYKKQEKGEIMARYLLITRKQKPDESMPSYIRLLKEMVTECNLKAVDSPSREDEYVRDAFINGVSSPYVRQRLLENQASDLQTILAQALSMDKAENDAKMFIQNPVAAAVPKQEEPKTPSNQSDDEQLSAAMNKSKTQKCYFCGLSKHPRDKCPAREAVCNKCEKVGHYAKACRSSGRKQKREPSDKSLNSILPVIASCHFKQNKHFPPGLRRVRMNVSINNHPTDNVFLDSGSTDSFIQASLATKLKLKITKLQSSVSLASTEQKVTTPGFCEAFIQYGNCEAQKTRLTVMNNLCAEMIIGLDILQRHSSVEIDLGGSLPPLKLCNFAQATIDPPSLFANLTNDCKPIADKSRKYSSEDREFISNEVSNLLKEDIIEKSNSPWRAQLLVTKGVNHKKRMVVDYSRTINRFTQLDAYPLPCLNDQVRAIANYKIFSTLDLKSAYHQIPIKEEERRYTAFEANGSLFQFKRIPFGVTNGVACFQRIIDEIIQKENLKGTYAYLDNVTVCGDNQESHDKNLKLFQQAAANYNLTFNNKKSIISKSSITLLGYLVGHKSIRPDPERLRPLNDLPAPTNTGELRRTLGLFSYYSQWIPRFSAVIRPLSSSKSFPLQEEAIRAFESLKEIVKAAMVTTIDPKTPLVVETDASSHTIAASLNQNGRPVAFFSRTLNSSESNHSSVEKEAYAIVEALRKWRHYLIGKHFKIVTDQQSVAFMYNPAGKGKIKNEKISRWRTELSCFRFDIMHRPGKENLVADALTRQHLCAIVGTTDELKAIHNSFCHPGITRMTHLVRSRNLPYSVEEIKRCIGQCSDCAELKPRFFKPPSKPLIKATRPFERLNVDFKGPLPSSSRNKFLFTVVDEYSRFPFAFPCSDTSTLSAIKCLNELFLTYGMPDYIHSDRGTSFMSSEYRNYLLQRGIAQSRTSIYNPEGNGQCERYNGIIWKSVQFALRSKKLPIGQWEEALPEALHSIRSLLSTATNQTPHERMFPFNRKSPTGCTLPTWLSNSGPVLYKRQVRTSKYDPLVDEVQLLNANSHYAQIKFPDGRETTVSTKHLAPCAEPEKQTFEDNLTEPENQEETENSSLEPTAPPTQTSSPEPRRSARIPKPRKIFDPSN